MALAKDNTGHYKPSIDDLHVGFDCEIRWGSDQPWIPKTFKPSTDLMYWDDVFSGKLQNGSDMRVNFLLKSEIEETGFEFYQSNGIRNWYKKTAPEAEGGNWYRYYMYSSVLIHEPENQWMKIKVDFSGGQSEEEMDTLFEGEVRCVNDLRKVFKKIRLSLKP